MTEHSSLQDLQVRLGHRFAQPALLQRALTHRSFSAEHFERLEFLGDAVLNLAVSTLLFEHFGQGSEGDLTRVRAHLVREETLHRAALHLGLPALLRMSEGEARGGGAQRPALLADAFEAVLGALMLDAGFERAQAAVHALFRPWLQQADASTFRKDAKTALQEWLQARRLAVPVYTIVGSEGRAHEQTFEVECAVAELNLARRAKGRSRRVAEQEAAARVFAALPATGKQE